MQVANLLEPGTIMLLAGGLLAVAARRQPNRRQNGRGPADPRHLPGSTPEAGHMPSGFQDGCL